MFSIYSDIPNYKFLTSQTPKILGGETKRSKAPKWLLPRQPKGKEIGAMLLLLWLLLLLLLL